MSILMSKPMAPLLVLVLALAACGDDNKDTRPDARVIPDASTTDVPPAPYRHAIVLDGNDDFASGDTFDTTSSPTFLARVAWDDVNLYVGYSGPDLAPTATDAAQKWVFVYLDTSAGGQTQGEQYNTQRATFPSGFGAEYYVRYKCDGTFATLERFDGADWITASPAPSTAQSGTFVELSIPLSAIGAGPALGVVTYMINEKSLSEGSYAGLYPNNFVDGYAANLALSAYLRADFTSPRVPNDLANRRP